MGTTHTYPLCVSCADRPGTNVVRGPILCAECQEFFDEVMDTNADDPYFDEASALAAMAAERLDAALWIDDTGSASLTTVALVALFALPVVMVVWFVALVAGSVAGTVA